MKTIYYYLIFLYNIILHRPILIIYYVTEEFSLGDIVSNACKDYLYKIIRIKKCNFGYPVTACYCIKCNKNEEDRENRRNLKYLERE